MLYHSLFLLPFSTWIYIHACPDKINSADKFFGYFYVMLSYLVGTNWNYLSESDPVSTYKKCFGAKIAKKFFFFLNTP